MNKQITLLSALAASLLASFAVQAADTTELKVKGTVRPAACVTSFTGTNTVDYGVIAAKNINLTAATVLPEKIVTLNVGCDSDIRFAISIIDNKASTTAAGLMTSIDASLFDKHAYGLGSADGKKIGAYSVRIITSGSSTRGTLNGTILTGLPILSDETNTGSWVITSSGRFNANGTARKTYPSYGQTSTPGNMQQMIASLGVTAVLDKGSNLPLTQNIDLDGSATIEVQYL